MRVGEWARIPPGPEEVLVRVRSVGICAGDMYIYQGKNPYVTYPSVGGHEISGTIVEGGRNVKEADARALVVVEPFISCGKCYPCRIGKSNCCADLKIIGMHLPGGFAEFVRAPARNIHVVPEGLSPVSASFAEPLAIGIQACRRGQVTAGEYVLILGCGPIGLALIEVALSRGARVVATDTKESRVEFAKTLGVEVIRGDEPLRERVMEQTKGDGAAVVIEATGNTAVMESTVDLVASGGRIVIVGLAGKGLDVRIPALDVTRKEMTILGSRGSVNCFPEALALLASGKVRYPSVATEFSMWDAPEVFRRLNRDPGAVHKGVLVID